MPYDLPQLYRFSVAKYHRLWEHGILDAALQIELLEGLLFENMPRNPVGNSVTRSFEESLAATLPSGCALTRSCPLPLARSVPESEPRPDYVLTGAGATGPGVVVEITGPHPTLERVDLGRIYARAGIPCYWVLDYADRVIEVFTQPSGPIESPHYAKRDRYPGGTSVPVVLDGNTVGTIAVSDVMG